MRGVLGYSVGIMMYSPQETRVEEEASGHNGGGARSAVEQTMYLVEPHMTAAANCSPRQGASALALLAR